ncbi:hypothetical protein Syun_028302 [Stephania yunnanensis]|uniref:Uncharacterized protein n=1 Tax=Stephania yunnanensis TaxID=152371 RepID=A0AAP0HR02_9MAGN
MFKVVIGFVPWFRRYFYRLLSGPELLSTFEKDRAWHIPKELDLVAMRGGCNGGRDHQCRYKGGGGGGGGGEEFLIIRYVGVVTIEGITYVLDVPASLFVEGITVVQDSTFV